MIGADEWGMVVEHAGHVVAIACAGGKIGSAYAGEVIYSAHENTWRAMPSRDLVRVGVVDVGRAQTFADRERAVEWLGAEAQRTARKFVFAGITRNAPIT